MYILIQILPDGLAIRANQGHSMQEVAVEMTELDVGSAPALALHVCPWAPRLHAPGGYCAACLETGTPAVCGSCRTACASIVLEPVLSHITSHCAATSPRVAPTGVGLAPSSAGVWGPRVVAI